MTDYNDGTSWTITQGESKGRAEDSAELGGQRTKSRETQVDGICGTEYQPGEMYSEKTSELFLVFLNTWL